MTQFKIGQIVKANNLSNTTYSITNKNNNCIMKVLSISKDYQLRDIFSGVIIKHDRQFETHKIYYELFCDNFDNVSIEITEDIIKEVL